jgi:hypothetical protein
MAYRNIAMTTFQHLFICVKSLQLGNLKDIKKLDFKILRLHVY